MFEGNQNLPEPIKAQNANGLREALDEALKLKQTQPTVYIDYQYGQAAVTIKLDLSVKPYMAWYLSSHGYDQSLTFDKNNPPKIPQENLEFILREKLGQDILLQNARQMLQRPESVAGEIDPVGMHASRHEVLTGSIQQRLGTLSKEVFSRSHYHPVAAAQPSVQHNLNLFNFAKVFDSLKAPGKLGLFGGSGKTSSEPKPTPTPGRNNTNKPSGSR